MHKNTNTRAGNKNMPGVTLAAVSRDEKGEPGESRWKGRPRAGISYFPWTGDLCTQATVKDASTFRLYKYSTTILKQKKRRDLIVLQI